MNEWMSAYSSLTGPKLGLFASRAWICAWSWAIRVLLSTSGAELTDDLSPELANVEVICNLLIIN